VSWIGKGAPVPHANDLLAREPHRSITSRFVVSSELVYTQSGRPAPASFHSLPGGRARLTLRAQQTGGLTLGRLAVS